MCLTKIKEKYENNNDSFNNNNKKVNLFPLPLKPTNKNNGFSSLCKNALNASLLTFTIAVFIRTLLVVPVTLLMLLSLLLVLPLYAVVDNSSVS